MGIYKEIEASSGITFKYHRVLSLMSIVNRQNCIEVARYTSADKRAEEAEAVATGGSFDALVDCVFISAPYDPTMTVKDAYAYIMTLPEYEGAEMEDTEYMLDAIETVPKIEAELAEQQQADIQQPQEEGDVE